ncbi:MAG: hypothetical protein Kow0037_05800 [Calditrichia bacterium]
MKRIVVTGAGGTVGRALLPCLRQKGCKVFPLSHRHFRMWEWGEMERLLDQYRPESIFHLALASQPTGLPDEGRLVNEEWPLALAKWGARNGTQLIFTSTVMVFGDDQPGPFRPETPPRPNSDYGKQKLMVERRLAELHGDLVIARLGWQIGTDFSGNQMLAYLHNQLRQKGEVVCSPAFYPSCSFLGQTAEALSSLPEKPPGLYLINANRDLSFYRIARLLQKRFNLPGKILSEEVFRQDQRMLDEKIVLPDLQAEFPEAVGKFGKDLP